MRRLREVFVYRTSADCSSCFELGDARILLNRGVGNQQYRQVHHKPQHGAEIQADDCGACTSPLVLCLKISMGIYFCCVYREMAVGNLFGNKLDRGPCELGYLLHGQAKIHLAASSSNYRVYTGFSPR